MGFYYYYETYENHRNIGLFVEYPVYLVYSFLYVQYISFPDVTLRCIFYFA